MSDDNGDAANESGGSGGAFPGGDASIDDRLETIHRTIANLGTRIDALVTSTTTYRSALTDRLTEYANHVTKLSRAQAADLEEFRQANQRTVAELRRGLASSDEVLGRVGERIDSLLTERGSSDESLSVLAEVRDALAAQENVSRSLGATLDRFGERFDETREALLDVASGEVVGALWDEVRSARESLDTLVARAGEEAAGAGTGEDAAAVRADVVALTSAVRELLDHAEVVDEDGSAGLLDTVAADIAALRSELSEGLVVEPSDALAGTVDQLRAELAGLDDRMRSVAESVTRSSEESAPDGTLVAVADDLSALRSELVRRLDELPEQLATATAGAIDGAPGADVEGELRVLRTGVEGVDGDLRALRMGVEDIIGRLDEGIVLAEEITPPAGAATSSEFADHFASLRDQVTTEFDALRQLFDDVASRVASEPAPGSTPDASVDLAPVTELLEHVRDDLAELPERISDRTPVPEAAGAETEYASLDPDTIDLLRDEIRSAGGVSDEVIAALRNDLVALRRRIKLRAEGELFTADQLDHIAEAVARRLGE